MNISILRSIYILMFFSFGIVNCNTMFEFTVQSDKSFQQCSMECIKKCKCEHQCQEHYVLTDCMEKVCPNCKEEVELCIDKCRQERSEYINASVESSCTDPWMFCPSCGMDI